MSVIDYKNQTVKPLDSWPNDDLKSDSFPKHSIEDFWEVMDTRRNSDAGIMTDEWIQNCHRDETPKNHFINCPKLLFCHHITNYFLFNSSILLLYAGMSPNTALPIG